MQVRVPNVKLDQEPSMRERIMLGAVAVGILVFFYNAFWSPHMRTVAITKVQLSTLKTQADAIAKLVETTKTQIAKQAAQPAQAPVDERTNRLLRRRVPDPADEINATSDLLASRRFAKRAEIKKVDIADRIEKGNYFIVPFSVEMTAPYAGLQQYLRSLEQVELPLVVRGFHLTQSKSLPGTVEGTIDTELYVFK